MPTDMSQQTEPEQGDKATVVVPAGLLVGYGAAHPAGTVPSMQETIDARP